MTLKPPIAAGSIIRTSADAGLEVGGQRCHRLALELHEQLARTERGEESALGGRAEMDEARAGRGGLDRGHVDVGRQVLPADGLVDVVVGAMAQIGEQRPARTGAAGRRASPPGRRSR